MEIYELIVQYGIMNVIIGIIACIICGFIKLPIIKKLKAKGYGEKETSQKIGDICTVIVSIVSIAGVMIVKGILKDFDWISIASDILVSITCSKIVYALYEGNYKTGNQKLSIKAWAHKVYEKIKAKTSKEIPENVKDVVGIVQNALIEETKLPLTDEQIKHLAEVLKGKI